MSPNETPADVIREAAGPDWRRPRGSESAAGNLTVRDYFAAKALPLARDEDVQEHGYASDKRCAARSFEMADAMLAARSAK